LLCITIRAMAPRAKVEKRMDRDTGVKYTEAEFLEHYGNSKGSKIWAAAGKRDAEPVSTSSSGQKAKGKREKRLDRDTGAKYTEEEFLEFYGKKKGSKIWEAAGRAAEPPATATKAEGKKGEKRTDRNDGKKYTEKQFLETYGETKGAKIWAAAGRQEEAAAAADSSTKAKGKKGEKRTDRTDGKKYTEKQFLETYGEKKGAKVWAAAGRQEEAAAAADSSTKAKGKKGEKRTDRNDGKKHTEKEFLATYGEKKGAKIWEAAGRQEAAAAAPGAKATAKTAPKAKAKATPKAKESKPKKALKVCVCGGAGGIGQPLSMLMASDPNVSELSVFDLNIAMVPPEGVAADLSHIETKCKVVGYVADKDTKPIDCLEACLTGCNLVLIPAGLPRKPGMTRDDLFKVNAGIAKNLVEACAKFCPDAVLALIVNPVNSIVPAMAALYEKKGLNPLNIVGVTTLDCVRANKFVGEITGKNPKFIQVPVIGGHAGVTILPLFSQEKSAATIEADKIPALDKKVQDAGTEVVEAKAGKGSATLSMAYAGARMGSAILKGLQGVKRIECAYVKSDHTDLPYFSSKVVLGEKGVSKVLPLGELNEYEKTRLEEVKTALKAEIETGLAYAKDNELA